MVAFELFVRPALLAMQAAAVVDRRAAPVVLPTAMTSRPAGHYLRRASSATARP